MAKLMTKRIEQSLLQHPLSSQDGKGFNAEIAVMFYNSEGPGTWILTEGENRKWRLVTIRLLLHLGMGMGLCDAI